MATLNIKNFPEGLYEQLAARARRERRSIAQEVTCILRDTLDQPPPQSILKLRGLGKDLWNGIDPTAHVDEERRSWD